MKPNTNAVWPVLCAWVMLLMGPHPLLAKPRKVAQASPRAAASKRKRRKRIRRRKRRRLRMNRRQKATSTRKPIRSKNVKNAGPPLPPLPPGGPTSRPVAPTSRPVLVRSGPASRPSSRPARQKPPARRKKLQVDQDITILGDPKKLEEAPLISSIRVQGLRNRKPKDVLKNLFSQRGGAFSLRVLRWDLRRLRKQGFFSVVKATVKYQAGLVDLIFVVKESGAWIKKIYFSGNRLFQAQQLLGRIQLQPNTAFHPKDPAQKERLAQDARRVIKMYHQLGYYRVRVTVRGSWTKNKSALVLWFLIQENQPAKIRRVTLLGNRQVPTKELRKVLDSKPRNVGSFLTGTGTYHPSLVARDLYFLRNYYYDHGFLQSRVHGPQLQVSRDRRSVSLTYRIDEGPKYNYGRIEFFGDRIASAKVMRSWLKIKRGDVFNRSLLYKENILPLLRRYRNLGYAYAKIRPVPMIDPVTLEVNLRLVIRKGSLIRIERVNLQGNVETLDFVIRREILLKPGMLYHQTKLEQSQRLVYALGFFLPTDRKLGVKVTQQEGSKPNSMILTFLIRERPTWIYPIPSIGFLPDFGWLFSLGIGKSNFLGRGQTVLLRGLVSTSMRYWNVYAYFIEPRLFGTRLNFNLSGFQTYYEPLVAGFARERAEGNLSLAHPLGRRWLRGSLRYRLGRASIRTAGQRDPFRKIGGYEGAWWISSIQASLQVGGRGFRPGWGQVRTWSTLSLEHAASYLGADYNLNRIEATTRWYIPLPGSLLLKAALNLGVLLPFGESTTIPTFERYFLGGIYSIRGYPLESISPTRTIPSQSDGAFGQGQIFWGGDKKLLLNLELEIPLVRSLQLSGVVFFDAGNVFDRGSFFFQDLENSKLPLGLYMSVGFGFRFMVPNLGPMRFEWGIPLTPRAGFEGGLLFGFTVGETIF